MLDAVLREEFSMLVSCQQVLFVVNIVACRIWLLYAASRWSIVSCCCKSDKTAVRKFHLLLHKSLAERTSADDCSAVVVLYCSSKDFRCGGRSLIDKNDERYFLIASPSVALVVLSRRLASLCIYDEFILWQEFVDHLYRRFQVSASVVSQVDNKVAESFLRQLCQCDKQFRISVLSKVLYLYVSGIVVKHIYRSDALLWNVSTGDSKIFHSV